MATDGLKELRTAVDVLMVQKHWVLESSDVSASLYLMFNIYYSRNCVVCHWIFECLVPIRTQLALCSVSLHTYYLIDIYMLGAQETAFSTPVHPARPQVMEPRAHDLAHTQAALIDPGVMAHRGATQRTGGTQNVHRADRIVDDASAYGVLGRGGGHCL